MIADMGWLAEQAKSIHALFNGLFFTLITVLLLLGVFMEYFKWPLGEMPNFAQLVGRSIVAVILLIAFPEILNVLSEITDAFAKELGDLNQFNLVCAKMGEKLHDLSWSWVSVKDMALLVISFLTFFVLYFSVFVADAFFVYSWTILYVFSPILIALFVLPQTAMATKALFRSLIEVSAWKLVWSVTATLLWSSALSKINENQTGVNFLTAICFNLILAGSILVTPFVVHALAGEGMGSMARSLGGIAVGGATITPKSVHSYATEKAKSIYNSAPAKRVRESVAESSFVKRIQSEPRIVRKVVPNNKSKT
jgi:hypothetical protein